MATEAVFVGDDFTGASDSLATYARHGWRSTLVLGGETAGASPGLDALGLATDLRSLDPDKASAEVERRWPLIEGADPRVLHLKVCSTFDSSPSVGSIGAVASDLIARFGPDVIAVIGGQPSLGRYCVFGNLFARGPDNAVHRIDRHPIMSRHPVTPMNEPDLRLHLAAQGLADLELVPFPALEDTSMVVSAMRRGPVLIDVTSASDQEWIARALQVAGGRQLLIGASSVAEIVAAAPGQSRHPGGIPAPDLDGVLVFAGSRSSTTQDQVQASRAYRTLALTPDALRAGTLIGEAVAALHDGSPVLVHLLPDADYGLSPDELADASGSFVAAVLDQADIGYLGLAGGDTSGRICTRLGFDALDYEENLAPGVSVCSASHGDPRRDRMRILLKGGQMGTPDLFDRFAEGRPGHE